MNAQLLSYHASGTLLKLLGATPFSSLAPRTYDTKCWKVELVRNPGPAGTERVSKTDG